MRRLLYSLSLTITLLPAIAQAQQPTALSLKDAMDYAVQNNVNVKNARLDVLIQEAKNAEVSGTTLPQLNAKGEYNRFLKVPTQFLPGSFFGGDANSTIPVEMGLKNTASANATLSQILFDGSLFVALQARKEIMNLSNQSARFTEEETRYNVARAYNAFVIAKRQFGILTESLVTARGILGDVAALQRAGFAEKIEVDRINVQINNLATDSIRIQSLLSVSEQMLKYTIGMDINQPIVLTDTNVEGRLSNAAAMIGEGIDYNKRTDYMLLQSQLQLNKYDLKRHRFSALPSLAAFANGGYNFADNRLSKFFDRATYPFSSLVGLQLNVPIFDGFQRSNRIKQAKLNITKTENNLEYLRLGIDLQSNQSKTVLRNSLLALQSQQRNMELARSVLNLAQIKYKEGVGSNLEVSQAQTELLQAQNNYFQSLLEVVNAQADLQRALGQFK